ncbi:TPA: hypothetical protein NPN71_005168 [Klebsiella quasipneumoniae subsp. quasipneumoniae]|uniref:hypothetical protein n=1 Tax=Klebsiella quasipneumoniae TaxID=1463165 RepID=UPI0013EF8C89|nr:hypothetical protein [Klebsiella quasipneumoniae]HCI6033305.1 hypothetical protein [Klebsiella quasipneumoniae subsp. quasipneumoniae]HCI6811728.1 hypothetical protein [Klebsiella quasipneumoniae subsp. quasipneumoniae]
MKKVLQWIHFKCNNVTGFVEIEPDGSMWVHFAGSRMAYSMMQGKLKNVVHSLMVQHSIISSWRN